MMNSNNNYYLISFLIPAYKVEKYIQECLDSIILQYNPYDISFQICICLDLSIQEDKKHIAHYYALNYPFVKLIFDDMANTKIPDSRNTLLKNGDGTYFSFLDGDDLIAQYTLYYISKFLLSEKPDLLTTNVSQFFQLGDDKIPENIFSLFTINEQKPLKIERENPSTLYKFLTFSGLHGKFFKASLIKGFKFLPDLTEEDKMLTFYLNIESKNTWHIPTNTVMYRIHNTSLLRRNKNKISPNVDSLIKDIEVQLKNVTSFITDQDFFDAMKPLILYAMLSTSVAFRLFMHGYIFNSLHYFKIKKDVANIFLFAQYFYNKYLANYTVSTKFLLNSLDHRLFYYENDIKAKNFIKSYNTKFFFIYKFLNKLKKLIFFYK